MKEKEWGWVRDRVSETERETERERESEWDRERDRERERVSETERERDRERESERETEEETKTEWKRVIRKYTEQNQSELIDDFKLFTRNVLKKWIVLTYFNFSWLRNVRSIQLLSLVRTVRPRPTTMSCFITFGQSHNWKNLSGRGMRCVRVSEREREYVVH